jgi:hypothetical protein
MRKIGIVVFCVSFCLAIAFLLPQLSTSTDLVDDELCLSCHDHDTFKSVHDNDCNRCHSEGYTAPSTATCIQCHPLDGPGECNLVDFHDSFVSDCLTCHTDCNEVPDTTTVPVATTTTTPVEPTTTIPVDSTTTTAATQTCPTEAIYGVDSEEVEILRYFRDDTLSTTQEGQEMIRLYYQWSPALTRAIQNDEAFGKRVKEITDRVLLMITKGAQ